MGSWQPPRRAIPGSSSTRRVRRGAVPLDTPRTEVPLVMRAVRWGRHEVRCDAVRVTSPVGAFRISLIPSSIVVTALPLADTFAATDALPRPSGLVGLHRSRRQGEGGEPAEVRPFRPGDRLRRINWPVSSRTGTLHVTATWSDRDTEVMLLLDTEHDLGISEGVDGRASSLDIAVRAAAAIAEHYLRTGDRVGAHRHRAARPHRPGRQRPPAPASPARRARGVVAGRRAEPGGRDGCGRVRAGSLVVALSPLLGGAGVAQIAQLVRHRPRRRRHRHAAAARPRIAGPVAGAGVASAHARARVEIDRLASSACPWCDGAAEAPSTRSCACVSRVAVGAEADPLMDLAEWISATIAAARRIPPVSWMLRGFIALAGDDRSARHDAAGLGRRRTCYVAAAILAAVVCAIVPDTIAALLLVAMVGVCWLARAPGEVSVRLPSSPHWHCSSSTSAPLWPRRCPATRHDRQGDLAHVGSAWAGARRVHRRRRPASPPSSRRGHHRARSSSSCWRSAAVAALAWQVAHRP